MFLVGGLLIKNGVEADKPVSVRTELIKQEVRGAGFSIINWSYS